MGISRVFLEGEFQVSLLKLEPKSSEVSPAPPKPVLIASPLTEGDYPVLLFLHGYLLYNSFYSQLFRHIASHGFIVVAPQLYNVAGPDSTKEIHAACSVTNWMLKGLHQVLPSQVRPDLNKLSIAGHSRGGKVAFALALGHSGSSLTFSAIMGIDPVDGRDQGKQTNPPILTYKPRSLPLNMPALVVGSGLGELKKNHLFPPCAPKGVNHEDFFKECEPPIYYFVAKDYGHLDMLDDETPGIRGQISYCVCQNGKSREPMRTFVGGTMIAFMRSFINGDFKDLTVIKMEPEMLPLELSVVEVYDTKDDLISQKVTMK